MTGQGIVHISMDAAVLIPHVLFLIIKRRRLNIRALTAIQYRKVLIQIRKRRRSILIMMLRDLY